MAVTIALLVGFFFITPTQPARGAAEKIVFATTGAGLIGFVTAIVKVKKFDQRNGVDLALKFFSPGKAMQILVQKNVDAGLLGVAAAVRANVRKNRLRFLMPLMTANWSVVVGATSPYRSFGDLKGERVGSLPRVTGIYSIAALILKMQNIEIEKQFKLVFGPPQVLQGLLIKKELSAVIQFDQNTVRRISDGQFREMLNLGELWKQKTGAQFLMSVGVAAYEDWITANPQRAKGLVRTIADAIGFIHKDTAAAIDLAPKTLGLKTAAHRALAAKLIPRMYPTAWDAELQKNTKFSIQKSIEFGLLKRQGAQYIDDIFKYTAAEITF